MDEEERKRKMDPVSLGSSLASEGFLKIYLLTCGRRIFVSGTQNEIVVS